MADTVNPHRTQTVIAAGAPLAEARSAMIMIHGRGASAHDILGLSQEFRATGMAFLAPQAAGGSWYPQRFIVPVAQNEPWLSGALETVAALLDRVATAGVPTERTILLGFSQGACLALEFAARTPQRYGGLAGLSGALIENGDQPRPYQGSLAGTPAVLGCATTDFHIPKGRVERSADLLRDLGAAVTLRLYPGMGHTINDDEIGLVQAMIDAVG
jgi:predicted esterase